ncbi:MAG TPA: outer membrane protein assembly factor BamD [Spongiibacteraceae bacterium]|nr:outer membrane protein assembly factor BamD [Spongiibacteraceae bacterium]
MRKLPLIAVLATVTLLVACSSKDKRDSMSERDLYMEAERYLKNENFDLATKDLQLLESRFPFGPYAEQAQLELIYSQYRSAQNEEAAATAERFIRLHPQHPKVDYAYYMKGLANYTEGTGFLERFLPTDMTERDPGKALQSFDDFRQLLNRFPDSEYAPDALARMTYLRARLARYEINVANYYFRRKAYLAAANRGRYVVENYPQTEAVPDALAVMVQAYQLLGLNGLANDALKVLRTNFPEHPSLDANGNFISKFSIANSPQHHSWVHTLTLGLFDKAEPPKFDNRAEYLRY